jgi:predicted phosphodiesterase
MKLAIISDIHANLEALRATLAGIAADPVDHIVCLGDIVGYNANPAECIAELRKLQALCVTGNHDRAVLGEISTDGFPPEGARAAWWTYGQLGKDAIEFLGTLPFTRVVGGQLVAVHGALHPPFGKELVRLDNDERRIQSAEALLTHPSGARICAFGHTHQLGIYEYREGILRSLAGDEVQLCSDAVYLVNPGSVGQPRTAEKRATYLVLDTVGQVISVRRVAYDAAAVFAKTQAAGLAPRPSPWPAPVKRVLKPVARALGLLKH